MNLHRLKNRLLSRALTRFPRLAKSFIESYSPGESKSIPWTPFTKRLSECSIAIVTTAGVHHREQQPFDMADRDGDSSYRVIDAGRRADSLMITHDYYDHRDADRDVNVVFPFERLREFAGEGIIRKPAVRHYSFMGHITGPHILTLMNQTAVEVAHRLKQDDVDAVLLTPG